MEVLFRSVDAGDDLSGFELLIVGKAALTLEGAAPNIARVRDGLRVIVFEQTADVLQKRLGFRVAEYGLRHLFRRIPNHPIVAGLSDEQLRDWRGEATSVPPRLTYEMRPRYGPTVQWCGIPVTRLWRCGNRGSVASILIEKPARGDFLPILDGGYSLQYSPLLEHREGGGVIIFCQMDVTGRTDSDPAADTLVRNLLSYVAGWKAAPRRAAIYVGDPAGQSHIESSGIAIRPYAREKLTADHVLVIGPGGGKSLAGDASLADWLRGGGRLLAIGVDEQDVTALAPLKIEMKKAEHLSTFFEVSQVRPLFAGVGPADVHNRDPKELPLVSGGARVLGDGVLANVEDMNVVFCQLAPWEFGGSNQLNLKKTFRRSSFLLARLLANMGVASSSPIVERFSAPVNAAQTEKRWLEGLYLDKPEEWDDPYRFFRW
jgi:hypothetical protein